MTSTKLNRLLGRGALGNGLRVVAGAVMVSKGTLVVSTGGRRLTLVPHPDGTTRVEGNEPAGPEAPVGTTRVEVRFGRPLRVDDRTLEWAELAVTLAAATVARPTERPSIHWHDPGSFAGLLRDAVPGTTVRRVVEQFAGLSGPKSGPVLAGATGLAAHLPTDQADQLFSRMQAATKRPPHTALGRVGDLPAWGRPQREETYLRLPGSLRMPVVAEVWARPAAGDFEAGEGYTITVCVNRTPCTAAVELYTSKNDRTPNLVVTGAGLHHAFKARHRPVELLVNVQCPAVPLLNDGKSPDLNQLAGMLTGLMGKVVKSAQRATAGAVACGLSQKAVVEANVDAAVDAISQGGKLRYSLRQLFYAIRPELLEACGKEPSYDTFTQIIAGIEDRRGCDMPGMYRDNRGTLYHPHDGREMPLGTRTVEGYSRPPLLFNKVVYCEKEGFFPLLKDAGFPERHDCALVTSKGFASRAVGDLLALMGAGDEPLTVFCVHDADGPGTVIQDALVAGVRKRAGRRVEVVNLGLDPAEARGLGLPEEPVERKGGRAVPVGKYLPAESQQWLQTRRVELNAMTPAAFLSWLEGKMAAHSGKVVPPPSAVAERLAAEAERLVRDRITTQLLHAGGLDEKVQQELDRLAPALAAAVDDLALTLPDRLAPRPREHWGAFVADTASVVVGEK